MTLLRFHQIYLLVFQLFTFAAMATAAAPAQLQALYDEAELAVEADDIEKAHKLYQQAAEQGHVLSMLELGAIIGSGYTYGEDYADTFPADREKALEWFRKARDSGDADGQSFYALLQVTGQVGRATYRDIKGVVDPKAGIRTLEQLANKGDLTSMHRIASIYDDEAHGQRDTKKAFEWYQKIEAMGMGSDHSTNRFNTLRYVLEAPREALLANYRQSVLRAANSRNPSQLRRDYFISYVHTLHDSGLSYAEVAEVAGEPFAELVDVDFYAASALITDRGLPQVVKDTFLQKRLNADQIAEIRLIGSYNNRRPDSLKPRISPGEGWTEAGSGTVSVAGAPGAQNLYRQGEEAQRRKDYEEARKLLKEAADMGNLAAQHSYAQLVATSHGGKVDYEAARVYYLRAAERGDPRSMHAYARLLLEGRGGAGDKQGGIGWLEKAAERDALAAAQLASEYEIGYNVTRDTAKAIELYEQSVKLGSYSSNRGIERLRKAATTTQEQKLAEYLEQLAAAATAARPSAERGRALAAYMRASYDSGLSAGEVAQITRPQLDEMIEMDFHGVYFARSQVFTTTGYYPLRVVFENLFTPRQYDVIARIAANRAEQPAGIEPGQGWSEVFTQSESLTAEETPKPKSLLYHQLANVKSWDDFFDVVAAEKSAYMSEAFAMDYAGSFPDKGEVIREAYRSALARNKPLPVDGRGAFAGRMFLSYHKALITSGLSPEAVAAFTREDFVNMANADIYAAFEGMPTGTPHLTLFRDFLSASQKTRVQQIANDTLAARRSGSGAGPRASVTVPIGQQTAATGFQTFQQYPNDFRRNLPGHWHVSANMFGGGNQQVMEVLFGNAGGQSTSMETNPFATNSNSYPVRIVENKVQGGVWFQIIVEYQDMRFKGAVRDGGISGEITDKSDRQIGTFRMTKTIDRDYYARAQAAQRAKNVEATIHYYTEALKHRKRAEYYLARGGLYLSQKNYEAAIADQTEALKLDRNHSGALFNRAVAYHENKNYQAALADADALIAKHPKFERIDSVYFVRAESLWWLKRTEEAEAAYAKAIALNSKIADWPRAANTAAGSMAVFNQLQAGIAQTLEDAGATLQTAEATGMESTADLTRKLYATLLQNMKEPDNSKQVGLTQWQTTATNQLLQMIPLVAEQDRKDYQKVLDEHSKDLPAMDIFLAGNRAYSAGNLAEGVRLWEQAAAQGNSRAILNLVARVYPKGIEGVAKAQPERISGLMHKVAETGYPQAYYYLALYYGGLYDNTRDYKQGMLWAEKAYQSGDRYSGYLLFHHMLQTRIDEERRLVLYSPGSAEQRAMQEEIKTTFAALTDSALRGDPSSMYTLATCLYAGQLPGTRSGYLSQRIDHNLPLARFWFQQALAIDKRDNQHANEDREDAKLKITQIDATLALAKGRQWTADEIRTALESGIPQYALAYMIDREGARLSKRDNDRLTASDAWKNVPGYSRLSITVSDKTVMGVGQETIDIAVAAINERKRSVKANPIPQDTPEVRKRYAAGDPTAAYELYQVLRAQNPHVWPENEPTVSELRERAIANDYAPAQHLRVITERLEYNRDKSKRDAARMVQLLRTAAEAGDAAAASQLGRVYAATGSENGVRRNFVEAEYWYIQAAALAWPEQFSGSYSPETYLAQIYNLETPTGLTSLTLRAYDEATQRWIRELRKRGGVLQEIADEKIAYYATSDGGNTQVEPLLAALPPEQPAFSERELQRLEAAAKGGDVTALLSLARAYAYGERGLRQRDDLAVQLHQQAADKGSKEAMAALAEHYEKGYGVNKNLPLAVEFKARSEGKTLSPAEIAYAAGEIAREDSDQIHLTRDYYRQAAEAGLPQAMQMLGSTLADNRYGEPDPEASFDWLLKAAEAGNRQAMTTLVFRYERGENGAPKDIARSFYWREKSAEAGDRLMMSAVAYAYQNGDKGAPKDLQKALFWHRKALEAGNTSSRSSVDMLERELGAAATAPR